MQLGVRSKLGCLNLEIEAFGDKDVKDREHLLNEPTCGIDFCFSMILCIRTELTGSS